MAASSSRIADRQLRLGAIRPNPNTVPATIVSLVEDRESVCQAELLNMMATADFRHPKAKPQSKAWCAGYVAGAIRSSFLAVVAEPSTTVADKPDTSSHQEG